MVDANTMHPRPVGFDFATQESARWAARRLRGIGTPQAKENQS